MRLKSKNYISIDFGARYIKVVEGSFRNKNLSILNKLIIKLPRGVYENGYIKDINTLKELIDSALSLNNIKRRNVVAVISSSNILTRCISLPNINSNEIKGIIKYSIEDYIPIDLKDYEVQYINQGPYLEDDTSKIKIFIIAMPKKIIDAHFSLLKDLGFKPKVLDIQSNSITKLISLTNINKSKLNIAMLDIGYFNTNITIIENENIIISKTIPLGMKEIFKNTNISLEEKEILEELFNIDHMDKKNLEISSALNSFLIKIFENIGMIFSYYDSLNISNEINLIILQGGILKIKNIYEKFEKYLKIKTINIQSLNNEEEKLYLYSNAIGGLIRRENI